MIKPSAYISTPTIAAANLEQYWDVIRRLDPELYLIKCALKETGVNPMILPRIIRSIFYMATGTKFGTIRVFMSNGVITAIKGEESDRVNLEAVGGGE